MDDVTKLCTRDCQDSAIAWGESVASSCAGQTIFYNNMAIPADLIPVRHIEGLHLACLTNEEGVLCLVQSQDWNGVDTLYELDGEPDCKRDIFQCALVYC